MRRVGEALRAAGVRAIYLVHGTFVGTDAFGLIGAATRYLPELRRTLHRRAKRLADTIIGESGNYTSGYAKLFEEALADEDPFAPRIPVRLFHWSSENNHIGRAAAAVLLIEELHRLAESAAGGRVLLWGHSHAGNVFPLVTCLLAADAEDLAAFFHAARTYYRSPFGRIDLPEWPHVRNLLQESPRPIDGLALDFVTFGTPIRYGWDASQCPNLLHFVNHRTAEGLPPYQAPFPPKPRDVLYATHGDYIQQLGIAGTNVAPGILEWRTWLANRRLGRLLQLGVRRRDLWSNLAHGMRVPDAGTTLLVDYCDAGEDFMHHIAGHAVYTRREWLLFHAEEVCRRLYAA